MFDLTKNEDVLALLKEFGPKELEIFDIKPLKHGWKNFVYLVNNNLIVRFPKTNKLDLIKEAKFLDVLNHKAFLSTPKVSYVHFDPNFIVYDFIKGTILERDAFNFIDKDVVSSQLADFFYDIHTLTDLDDLQDLEFFSYDYIKEIEDTILETNFLISNINSLTDYIHENQLGSITSQRLADFIKYWQSESVVFLTDPNKETRLIHDDLHRKNILFDSNYKISGIIDFDEVKYGDIHLDFCNLIYSFDLDLVSKVMEKYTEKTKIELDFKKAFAMGAVYILSNLYRNFKNKENIVFGQSIELVLSWIKNGY